MRLDDIPRATELRAELERWREAERRCEYGVFKEAVLRVVDMAHGHPGINPSEIQRAETLLPLSHELVSMLAKREMGRIIGELRELGIEI